MQAKSQVRLLRICSHWWLLPKASREKKLHMTSLLHAKKIQDTWTQIRCLIFQRVGRSWPWVTSDNANEKKNWTSKPFGEIKL